MSLRAAFDNRQAFASDVRRVGARSGGSLRVDFSGAAGAR